MKEFLERYEERVAGVLNCFDRIIFKGHLPISWPEGMEGFLRREKVLVKDFKGYVTRVSQQVTDHARQVAVTAGRPYCHIRGKTDKEADARALAEADHITQGLICVFSGPVPSSRGGRELPGPKDALTLDASDQRLVRKKNQKALIEALEADLQQDPVRFF